MRPGYWPAFFGYPPFGFVSLERHDPFPVFDFDAADPMVQKLLDRTLALGIDNRGLYRLRHIQLHAVGRNSPWTAAMLANEEWNGTVTLITDEPLLRQAITSSGRALASRSPAKGVYTM